MAKLVLEISSTAPDGTSVTESHPLSYWLAGPRIFAKHLALAPTDIVDVRLHLTGSMQSVDQTDVLRLTYEFTARGA